VLSLPVGFCPCLRARCPECPALRLRTFPRCPYADYSSVPPARPPARPSALRLRAAPARCACALRRIATGANLIHRQPAETAADALAAAAAAAAADDPDDWMDIGEDDLERMLGARAAAAAGAPATAGTAADDPAAAAARGSPAERAAQARAAGPDVRPRQRVAVGGLACAAVLCARAAGGRSIAIRASRSAFAPLGTYREGYGYRS
jgi:hypothetical protein